MMSEDLFFNKVKETMHGYAPEVPASAYSGMRKKYAKSKFFSWNASTLNVWYVALVAVMGAVVFSTCVDTEMTASKAGSINVETEMLPAQVSSEKTLVSVQENASKPAETVFQHYKGEPCQSPSSLVEVNRDVTLEPQAVVDTKCVEVIAGEAEPSSADTKDTTPVEQTKVESAPRKQTRKLKAPVYKDK